MSTTIKRSRRGKRSLLFIALVLLVAFGAAIVYDLFLNQSPQVAGGIAVPGPVFRGHTRELWTVRFSPDGSLLASGGVDSAVRIWHRGNVGEVAVLRQPLGVTALEYSPEGQYILTASYDGIVRLWDWRARTVVRELKGHSGTVWSVAISPDGRTAASCGEDKTVKLWDVFTGTLLHTLEGHERNIWKVRFAAGGSRVVSSGFDRTIKVWDVQNGALLHTLKGHTQAVVGLAVSPDGYTLASSSDDKTIRLWDARTGRLLRTLRGWKEHVYAVAFSPDGARLVSGSRDNGTMGELLQNFFGDGVTPRGITVRLWEVASGRLLQTLSAHTDDVMDVTWSADGKSIASASDDHTVRLYRVVQ